MLFVHPAAKQIMVLKTLSLIQAAAKQIMLKVFSAHLQFPVSMSCRDGRFLVLGSFFRALGPFLIVRDHDQGRGSDFRLWPWGMTRVSDMMTW